MVADGGTFEAAFDELFIRAFGVARRFLPAPAAEDVAAEACARAYGLVGRATSRRAVR